MTPTPRGPAAWLLMGSLLCTRPVAAQAAPAADWYRDSHGQRRELTPWSGDQAGQRARLAASGLDPARVRLYGADGTRSPVGLSGGVLLALRQTPPASAGATQPSARPLGSDRPALPAAVLPVEALAELGLRCERALDRRGRRWRCQVDEQPDLAAAALSASRRAALLPEVAWAVPDFAVPLRFAAAPNDPLYSQQWNLQGVGPAHLHLEAAWDHTRGDAATVVAVLDTGLDTSHPDLEAGRIVTGYNAQDGSADVAPGLTAADAHGTACAGLVAATANNGRGISGVCPGCTLFPIKLGAALSNLALLSQLASAVEQAAARGAAVLSNSWSVPDEALASVDLAPLAAALTDAASEGRAGLGALVVFAAGNDGRTIDPRSLQALPAVLTVGASDDAGLPADYTNYGDGLSVLAPAGRADREVFQVATLDTRGNQGFNQLGRLVVPDQDGHDQTTGLAELEPSGDYTGWFTGTSAACPQVAGVAGLLFSLDPTLTANQVRALLEQTARPVGLGPWDQRGWNERSGFGQVDAGAALAAGALGAAGLPGERCRVPINCADTACRFERQGAPEGRCGLACAADSDCATDAGQACLPLYGGQGACLVACGSDADCPEPLHCAARGACIEPAPPAGGSSGCDCASGAPPALGGLALWLLLGVSRLTSAAGRGAAPRRSHEGSARPS